MLRRQFVMPLPVSFMVLTAFVIPKVASISLGAASVTLRVASVLLSLMKLRRPYAGTWSWTLFRNVSETQAPKHRFDASSTV